MIRLYTPVAPARTGTADYAMLLLRDLAAAGLEQEAISVVVDAAEGKPPHAAAVPGGYPVLSCRAVPDVVAPGETAIFFVANNEHHAYVHESLAGLTKCRGGRVIALVHEPCCAMLLDNLAYFRRHGFDEDRLVGLLAAQYGARAPRLLAEFRKGRLPDLFLFASHALGHVLAVADEIWTHSAFAALKLALESNVMPTSLPRFRLVAHPEYDYAASGTPAPRAINPGGDFVIGVFGWVALPKRVLEAIEGFYRFLCRLDPGEISRVRLVVVGALPDPAYYDPRGLAASLGIADWVEFHDYVDPAVFKTLQARADLVLNLRYPSCGETSGTMIHAEQAATPVIVTRYQAFREVETEERIGFLPGMEVDEIAAALSRGHAEWRAGRQRFQRRRASPPRQRVERLIAGIAASSRSPERSGRRPAVAGVGESPMP